jgi:hypothetical protein
MASDGCDSIGHACNANSRRNPIESDLVPKMNTNPEDPDFDPDAPGSACLWVEIEGENGELEWVHFFGLSHNAFLEMSKTARKPPWQLGPEPKDGEISF